MNVYEGDKFPQPGSELKEVKYVLDECRKMIKLVSPINEFGAKYEKAGKILSTEDIKKEFFDKRKIVPKDSCNQDLDKAIERELYDLIKKLAESD